MKNELKHDHSFKGVQPKKMKIISLFSLKKLRNIIKIIIYLIYFVRYKSSHNRATRYLSLMVMFYYCMCKLTEETRSRYNLWGPLFFTPLAWILGRWAAEWEEGRGFKVRRLLLGPEKLQPPCALKVLHMMELDGQKMSNQNIYYQL